MTNKLSRKKNYNSQIRTNPFILASATTGPCPNAKSSTSGQSTGNNTVRPQPKSTLALSRWKKLTGTAMFINRLGKIITTLLTQD